MVPPGAKAVVTVRFGGTSSSKYDIPAVALVGAAPGPRVTILAGLRGFEAAASAAAHRLAATLDASILRGSLLVVPVSRAGGRFGRPGRVYRPLSFPGDVVGGRLARLAFALHAEALVPAQILIELSTPSPGRQALLTVMGPADDARVGRLALACGAPVTVFGPPPVGSAVAAAVALGRVGLRLCVGGLPGGLRADADALILSVRKVLGAAGVLAPSTAEPKACAPASVIGEPVAVRAPARGFLADVVPVGCHVARGTRLASLTPATAIRARALGAAVDGIVLETPDRELARRGAILFTIGRLSREAGRRTSGPLSSRSVPAASTPKVRIGWAERVSLPGLGVVGLKAKIDTGARTSALHVLAARVVDQAGGPGGRPIMDLTLPVRGGGRGYLKVRVPVRDFIEVREPSGRKERRPVIETILELGPVRRRIRLTLTNRGDMQYPMLVGRTSLGPEVVVDPTARYLLTRA